MVPSTSSKSAALSQLPLAGDHSKMKEEVMREHQQRGWEGLASFIFGPDWFSIPLEGEDDTTDGARNKGGAASATTGNKDGKHLQSNGISNKPGGKTMLPNRPGDSKAISMASPKTGKGKQLSNMTGGNERSRSVSFSLDRKPSMGPDGGTDATVLLPANDGSGLSNNNNASTGRWHAPYLNSIPSFPLVTSTDDIANPHRLPGSKISLSMHDYATEMEACRETTTAAIIKQQRRGSASDSSDRKAEKRAEAAEKAMRKTLRIPDDVYNTMGIVWGSIKDASNKTGSVGDKKSRTESKKLAVDSSGSKVKFDPSSKQPSLLGGISDAEIIRPPHVPNFLPPYPTDEYYDLSQERLAASISTSSVMGDVLSRMHHREKRKASDITPSVNDTGEKKVNVSERDSVRRSVIGLGKSLGPSYWGSLDDDAGGDDKHNKKSNNNYLSSGNNLTDVTVAPVEGGNAAAATSPKKSTAEILPLGRASGSRVSCYFCTLYVVVTKTSETFYSQHVPMMSICSSYPKFWKGARHRQRGTLFLVSLSMLERREISGRIIIVPV